MKKIALNFGEKKIVKGTIKAVFKCLKGYREGEIHLFYLAAEDTS